MATTYITTTELAYLGVPTELTANLASAAVTANLEAASALADSYLKQRYTLPLATYGSDLKLVVAALASCNMLVVRGYDPNNPADQAIKLRCDWAKDWLEMVAKGKLTPEGVEDATPTTSLRGMRVRSVEDHRELRDEDWFDRT